MSDVLTPEELATIKDKLRPVFGALVDRPGFPAFIIANAIGGDPDPRDFGITGKSRAFLGMPPKDRWSLGAVFLGEGTPEAVINRLTTTGAMAKYIGQIG